MSGYVTEKLRVNFMAGIWNDTFLPCLPREIFSAPSQIGVRLASNQSKR